MNVLFLSELLYPHGSGAELVTLSLCRFVKQIKWFVGEPDMSLKTAIMLGSQSNSTCKRFSTEAATNLAIQNRETFLRKFSNEAVLDKLIRFCNILSKTSAAKLILG